ncbi:MAG: hypothetical protein AAGJ46_11490 [Planctomycetota bacterium]
MSRATASLRLDLALANANAAVWAVGNGLVSSTLVIYLALELGAPGSAIGLILAAPRFAGVLRITAPLLLARTQQRKRLCVSLLAVSCLILVAMPLSASPTLWPRPSADGISNGIWMLVGCWCLYHFFEYCGVVLLWAWLADVMPSRLRGRLTGRRESWLVGGRIAGALVSFWVIGYCRGIEPAMPRWQPFAVAAMAGAVVMLLSVAPLIAMTPRQSSPVRSPPQVWRALWQSLASPTYRRLLAYSVGLGIANGVSATAVAQYPWRVLGVSYEAMLTLRCGMRGGQLLLAPAAGRWFDRSPPRVLMTLAQLVVATGPLFFLIASPEAWGWIAGAYAAWVAYAVINVGLDHLKIQLAPPGEASPPLAGYYAMSDLAAGVMAVVGGLVYERLAAGGDDVLLVYALLFIAGALARAAVAGLAWQLSAGNAGETDR